MRAKSFWIQEIQACLQLAIPLAAAQLSEAVINFVDTIMMGQLGPKALAGGALGAVTFTTFLIVSTGMLSAVGAVAAIAFGAGDFPKLRLINAQGFWLTLLLSLPLMLLTWHFTPILRQLGQSEDHLPLTQAYLQSIVWGLPAALGFIALRNMTSALNRPRLVMIIMVTGILLNVGGNYVLMFGKLGFPTLGIAGIGWASTLAFWVKFLLLGIGIFYDRHLKPYHLFTRCYQIHLPVLWELLRIGTPSALLFLVEASLFTVITYLMGLWGTVSLAAHQIALQTAATTFMIPLGIAYATTMRVGQNLGRCDVKSAKRSGIVGILLSSWFMSLMAMILWFFPELVITIYLDVNQAENIEVFELSKSLLKVAAVFQIFDGVQVVANGALRGIKDTKIPLVIGIVCYWLVGFSSGYLLAQRLGLQAIGLWLGCVFGLMTAAVVLTWRFFHKVGYLSGQSCEPIVISNQ
ncbi:MATE family efflux transporter [Spirulina subsalsa FACHB-351]|uniref:Probable multidrug resistance protein NorM n=1 Tax=Spirulina subsalsa FACHB-351 TaxID=234711 RepID=A0ABT3L5F5_9CYAN|nr:MATE family efflux transporter [Spirulina subsalsa]MCW6036235.1 MATE family efflux transporter [Spirulina subsalsa FACHB-351]